MNAYIRTFDLVESADGFAVVINGKTVERVGLNRAAATAAADWWKRNYREEGWTATDGALTSQVQTLPVDTDLQDELDDDYDRMFDEDADVDEDRS